MSTSFVDIDRDEMEYVDGGGFGEHWWNTTKWVGRFADGIIIAIFGIVGAYSTYSAQKIIKQVAGSYLKKAVAAELSKYIGSAAISLFSAALDLGLTLAGSSAGAIIAEAFDRLDGKNDGYVLA